jgi:S-adenosylmethionine uptake transporter
MPNAHPSIDFLIRAWSLPTLFDVLIMAGLGLIWAGWMYCLSQAYSLAQASTLAPFEYFSLPINILWGFLFWQEIPTLMTLAGALLTLTSGFFVLYQKNKTQP